MPDADTTDAVQIPDPLKRKGIIFVLSAPSGTGKSTICKSLRQSSDFSFIVSYTTRSPRSGETNGEDYTFVDDSDFLNKIGDGFFLEHAHVHGLRYGTPKQDVIDRIHEGKDVVLDIDVEGARQIRAIKDPVIQDSLVDIFILPPSMEELEKRLRKRGTESDDQIEVRLKNAHGEIAAWNQYRYTLVSESMEEDLTKMRAIIKAERYRTGRLLEA